MGEAKAGKMTFTKWHSLLNLAFYTLVGLLFCSNALAGNTYTNHDFGFTIEFPENWAIKHSSSASTIIKAVHKDASGRIAQIAIAAYPWAAEGDVWDVTGAQMFERFMLEIPPEVDSVLLDSGKNTIGGEHALWTLIDVSSPPIFSMLVRSYHFNRRPILFRISTSTDRDATWFAQHEAEFDRAIRSFRFLGR